MVSYSTPERTQRGGPRPSGGGVFEAIADPTRRAILDLLGDGPRASGEIASGFPMTRPAVAKHLRALESAGLVSSAKVGRERRYRLEAGPLEQVDRWVTRYRMHWGARLMQLKEHAEQTHAVEGRGTEKGTP